jgi:hypothetical protein
VQDEDGGPLPNTKRKKKLLEFDRDDNDVPILEDPLKMIARVMEPVVRQFLSIHYSESIYPRRRNLMYLIFILSRHFFQWKEDCRRLDGAFRKPR